MKRVCVFAVVLMLAAGFAGCKKSDTAILEDEVRKTGNSAINKEIGELRAKLSSAKDDFAKSEIIGKISELESRKGDIGEAVKSANESIKLYPGLAMPHYVLGKSYTSTGRYSEAEVELQTAVGLDEKLQPAYYELGNLYYKLARFPESIENYQLAVKYDPNDYQAFNNLGSVYFKTGKDAEAEAAFNKVVSVKADFSPVYKNLGILYELKKKDKKKASAFYGEYLSRRPNAPDRAAVKIWKANMEK
jgi:tetratricopeptide (TPR) repeat protein